MTDATELANRIVALGVGHKSLQNPSRFVMGDEVITTLPEQFVSDWRVAGAMIETVDACYLEALRDGRWQAQASMGAVPTVWIEDESAPRAICEACVEARD